MKHIAIFGVLILAISHAHADTYVAGQVWSYETREADIESVATIVRVDQFDDLKIIHFSLNNLSFDIPNVPGRYTQADHIPISQEAFASSVTALIGTTTELPDYQPGYELWREAFDKAEAGYFSVSIAECVGFIEGTMRNGASVPD